MGATSWLHWLVVIVLIMLLFGRGKVSELMGDVAKGIKSFKKGLADDSDDVPAKSSRTIEHEQGSPGKTSNDRSSVN
jgi:sec-independent protein translocase protein TatA